MFTKRDPRSMLQRRLDAEATPALSACLEDACDLTCGLDTEPQRPVFSCRASTPIPGSPGCHRMRLVTG
jgi:hypothetical protein